MTDIEALRAIAKSVVSDINDACDIAHGAATAWCPDEAEELIVKALDAEITRLREDLDRLTRERDEARADAASWQAQAQRVAQDAVEFGTRAEAAEASIASYKEEVERLRGVLETIANLHIPDQPAHFGGDELEWAQRHVGTLRRLATEALSKEPPHAE